MPSAPPTPTPAERLAADIQRLAESLAACRRFGAGTLIALIVECLLEFAACLGRITAAADAPPSAHRPPPAGPARTGKPPESPLREPGMAARTALARPPRTRRRTPGATPPVLARPRPAEPARPRTLPQPRPRRRHPPSPPPLARARGAPFTARAKQALPRVLNVT